ncbi:hypothetical protein GCM10009740_06420 [Terrabacter terrae]|uniref:Sigma-70 family RNA polymerase sigma factor n=1 Tax=Terrabacter terrae TaxID=318434 RepID=A0ABP5F9Y7_9MICO
MSAHTVLVRPTSPELASTASTDLSAIPDAELLEQARDGDDAAFAALWHRHLPAAYAAATRFRGRVAAEDLVAEASARVLRLVRQGQGPALNFRAYFVSTVRSVGVDAVRGSITVVSTPSEDLDRLPGQLPDPEKAAVGDLEVDTELVRAAFHGLPDSDQELLWRTMVEGEAPRAVAPLLGVSANVVSARAMRARDALRTGYLDVWLQRHAPQCSGSECRWVHDHLSSYVRGKLTQRQRARAVTHLDTCPVDARLAADLGRLHAGFRGFVAPLVLAAGAASRALGHGPMAQLVGTHAASAGIGVSTAAGATATAASSATTATAVGATSTVAGTASTATSAAMTTAVTTATATTATATTATATTAATTAVTAATAATGSAVGAASAAAAAIVPAAVPVAAAAGGTAVLAGTTLGPPIATAVAGLVVGLGVSATPAIAHQLGPSPAVTRSVTVPATPTSPSGRGSASAVASLAQGLRLPAPGAPPTSMVLKTIEGAPTIVPVQVTGTSGSSPSTVEGMTTSAVPPGPSSPPAASATAGMPPVAGETGTPTASTDPSTDASATSSTAAPSSGPAAPTASATAPVVPGPVTSVPVPPEASEPVPSGTVTPQPSPTATDSATGSATAPVSSEPVESEPTSPAPAVTSSVAPGTASQAAPSGAAAEESAAPAAAPAS